MTARFWLGAALILLGTFSALNVSAHRQSGWLRPGDFFWEPELAPNGQLSRILDGACTLHQRSPKKFTISSHPGRQSWSPTPGAAPVAVGAFSFPDGIGWEMKLKIRSLKETLVDLSKRTEQGAPR